MSLPSWILRNVWRAQASPADLIVKIRLKVGVFSLICQMFAAFRRSWWCDFYPCFYRDKCINLGLGLFSYVCFSAIRFCSVYVIRLFSRCSRFLDPALDSIFHYLYHDHCLSWGFKQSFTTLGCYCLVFYGWLFFISYFFIHVFLWMLVEVGDYTET